MFIILTQEQANIVSGSSSISPYVALSPIVLTDGTYVLSESVLTDPKHIEHHTLLSSLPTKTVEEVRVLLPTPTD